MSTDVYRRFTSSFEEGMSYIWESYPKAVQQPIRGIPPSYDLMRTMVYYFLRFEPDGSRSDLYLKFATLMHNAQKLDKVRLVTLNYENLIEFALAAIGQPLRVIRPHGAVNWWVHGPTLKTDSGRALGAGLHIIGQKVKTVDRTTIHKRMDIEGKYPSMAVPIPEKKTQMGHRRIIPHRLRYKRVVMTAKKVAVIGVRPLSTDKHIWGILAQTPSTLYYVGDHNSFSEWCNEFRQNTESIWLGSTFEESISDLVDEL